MPRYDSNETIDARCPVDLSRATSITFPSTGLPRTVLAQEDLAFYALPLTEMRVHDDLASLLPGTAADDDLAIIEGTYGTDAPTIQSSDAKATTVTQHARFRFALPAEYVTGETVTLRVRGGMVTTISDDTATVDVVCYADDDDGGVSADLCATAAQSINSLSKANLDFTITPTALSAGDVLDVRMTVAITDAATGTAVIGEISRVAMMLDIRG